LPITLTLYNLPICKLPFSKSPLSKLLNMSSRHSCHMFLAGKTVVTSYVCMNILYVYMYICTCICVLCILGSLDRFIAGKYGRRIGYTYICLLCIVNSHHIFLTGKTAVTSYICMNICCVICVFMCICACMYVSCILDSRDRFPAIDFFGLL